MRKNIPLCLACCIVTTFVLMASPAAAVPFTPNDPYFDNSSTPGFYGQWNLKNPETPGLDINVWGAWQRGLTGAGVLIGIVDDGIETAHPDLAANYDSTNSYDFRDNDADPNPMLETEMKGTAVAGVAAARGGNGIGVTGVAPEAQFAALRIQSPDRFGENGGSAEQLAAATRYHSDGDNNSIKIKVHAYGYAPYQLHAEERAALEASADNGTIHVFGAGPDGEEAGTRDLQSSWAAISVTSVGSNGLHAGNFGANIFVCAPSYSDVTAVGITTTDRTGSDGVNPSSDAFPDPNYTSLFSGTSASSATVAGVIALGKQIRPNMDVRFAKHLLVRSSVVVDAGDSDFTSDGGWLANAAGYKFNPNYGFGLVDADAFTQLAAQYTGVTPLIVENTGLINVDQAIPDFVDPDNENFDPEAPTSVTYTFGIGTEAKLEEVLITLDVEHPYRGDIEAYLTSPSGTTRLLFSQGGADDTDNLTWTFLSNAYWGELAAGTWALTLKDLGPGDEGVWRSFSAEVRMGDLEAVPEPGTLALVGLGAIGLLAALRLRRTGR